MSELRIESVWSHVCGETWRVVLYHDLGHVWLSEGHKSEDDARNEVRRIAAPAPDPEI